MAITITVEDGSRVTGANSYVTVSGCDAYLEKYGEATWSASTVTTTMKQNALLKAMRYLDHLSWKGTKYTSTQTTSWPRSGVVDGNGYELDEDFVPPEVVAAQCELALRSLPSSSIKLQPDLPRGGRESATSMGSIAISYQSAAPPRAVITVVEDILKGLLKSKHNVNIVRG